MRDMEHLFVVDPLGMSTVFVDMMGMIRWTRDKSIIRCPKTIHRDGKRTRTLRVKLLWRAEPGIDLLLGPIFEIGMVVVVVVSNVSDQFY